MVLLNAQGQRKKKAAYASTATATKGTAALDSDGFEPRGHFLVGLAKELKEVSDDVLVAAVEEGSGSARVAGTTSTTDAIGEENIRVSWMHKA